MELPSPLTVGGAFDYLLATIVVLAIILALFFGALHYEILVF